MSYQTMMIGQQTTLSTGAVVAATGSVDGKATKRKTERNGMKSEWQPIETAPKDGTCILVFSAYEYDDFPPETGMDVTCWTENGWDFLIRDPTHWMPLPPPPVASP